MEEVKANSRLRAIELLPLQSYLSPQSKVTAANMAHDELITELSRRRTLPWPDAVEAASKLSLLLIDVRRWAKKPWARRI